MLVTLLTTDWFLASRVGPGAGPTVPASPGPSSAEVAIVSHGQTAAPSLQPNGTPGPGLTPGSTAGPSAVAPPSARPTPHPGQSQVPLPSATAAPTATPQAKSPSSSDVLPDLLAISYGLGNAQLACGTDNVSYVTIQNSGKAAAPKGITVLFQLVENGAVTWKETQTIPAEIAPGGSYTLKAAFPLTEPCAVDLPRTWSFSIDPDDALLESSEGNNSAALSWSSAAG